MYILGAGFTHSTFQYGNINRGMDIPFSILYYNPSWQTVRTYNSLTRWPVKIAMADEIFHLVQCRNVLDS